MTTQTTGNPFAKFSTAKEKTSSAKKEKDIIEIAGKEKEINRLAEITPQIQDLQAEEKMLKGEIKDVCREAYIKEYQKQGKRPDSFKIKSGNSKPLLLLVIDKYSKVEGPKAIALQKFPGTIETTTTYTINPAIMEKYGEAMAAALATVIPEEEMDKVFIANVVTEVKKGTIDRLLQYPNPAELFAVIDPQVQLKNAKA